MCPNSFIKINIWAENLDFILKCQVTQSCGCQQNLDIPYHKNLPIAIFEHVSHTFIKVLIVVYNTPTTRMWLQLCIGTISLLGWAIYHLYSIVQFVFLVVLDFKTHTRLSIPIIGIEEI